MCGRDVIYVAIEAGTYNERIKCRVGRLEGKEPSLGGKARLGVPRIPSIVHSEAFQPGERGFWLDIHVSQDGEDKDSNGRDSNGRDSNGKDSRDEDSNDKDSNGKDSTDIKSNNRDSKDITNTSRDSKDNSGNEGGRREAYGIWGVEEEEGCLAELVLEYSYFTHTELLKRAGIKESEYQSSYNRVGSIIHLNLKEETLPHKGIISKVLYDKIKDCRTVVRKVANISGVFRNIEIEHLQGVEDYKTVHRENGLRFSISYDKVYWNSKLQVERVRLMKEIKAGESICDLFCGVGPFAILALSRGARVWANDLNPESVRNFQESVKLNRKVLGVVSEKEAWDAGLEDRVRLFNLDAGEFLRVASGEIAQGGDSWGYFDHYILNLPELTLQYLQGFVELERKCPKQENQNSYQKSYVHAYFFVRPGEQAVDLVEQALGRKVEGKARLVRKVSPSKAMWLVSFVIGLPK
ncbi:tRNA (guanine37-N1)-methyltransferase [Nematocida homosporus]|uniref:tRNA (guanine37-N1)-methyltransferase n=1 Tax=Nematocida homosporus TaxID=1912981 RepID=UPI00221FC606|nr:tRNA (guanine37-N1)-methyltransferase [Nematocida homosporus]KAI5187610.1 tRNA (guanine37-N1)-methyltransferase [Nematocida homosporus]